MTYWLLDNFIKLVALFWINFIFHFHLIPKGHLIFNHDGFTIFYWLGIFQNAKNNLSDYLQRFYLNLPLKRTGSGIIPSANFFNWLGIFQNAKNNLSKFFAKVYLDWPLHSWLKLSCQFCFQFHPGGVWMWLNQWWSKHD